MQKAYESFSALKNKQHTIEQEQKQIEQINEDLLKICCSKTTEPNQEQLISELLSQKTVVKERIRVHMEYLDIIWNNANRTVDTLLIQSQELYDYVNSCRKIFVI